MVDQAQVEAGKQPEANQVADALNNCLVSINRLTGDNYSGMNATRDVLKAMKYLADSKGGFSPQEQTAYERATQTLDAKQKSLSPMRSRAQGTGNIGG
jgi:hypothetical protein